MEKGNTDELFSIKLNSDGTRHLQKFAVLVKGYLIIGMIFTILALVDFTVAMKIKHADYGDSFMNFYFKIYPFLSLCVTILFIIQLLCYRQIGIEVKKAILHTDEHLFNSALSYLTKSMWLAIAGTVFSILFVFADIVISIKFQL